MNIMGSVVENTITSAQSGGAYYQFRITVHAGEGVPPHVHAYEDELFYLLEGELALELDGKSLIGRKGEGFFLPRGVAHGYENRSGKNAQVLVLVSPGSSFEAFFVEMSRLSMRSEIDMGEVVALAGRHGITFTKP